MRRALRRAGSLVQRSARLLMRRRWREHLRVASPKVGSIMMVCIKRPMRDGRIAESCVAAWRMACEDDTELAHDVDAASGLAVLAGAQERDVALVVSSRAQAQVQVRSPTPTRSRRRAARHA